MKLPQLSIDQAALLRQLAATGPLLNPRPSVVVRRLIERDLARFCNKKNELIITRAGRDALASHEDVRRANWQDYQQRHREKKALPL